MSSQGPVIIERRPRARRRCLCCPRVILTTADRRLRRVCAAATAQLEEGAITEAASMLVRVQVDR